jgi:futalosine hydrolase
MFTTAAVTHSMQLERALAKQKPDFILQAGIAGSFHPDLPIGSVVQVVRETYAELGAESPEGYLNLEALGFANFKAGGRTYFNAIDNPNPPLAGIESVTGISVNRVHGTAESIAQIRQQWNADIESMEGAAFFQVCLEHTISFAEIRAISNFVEPRNRESWDIPGALGKLSDAEDELLMRELK